MEIRYNIESSNLFPLEALNALKGISAEIIGDEAIIQVDETKYTETNGMFHLGRFIELNIANKQLRLLQNTIMLLTQSRE